MGLLTLTTGIPTPNIPEQIPTLFTTEDRLDFRILLNTAVQA